MIRLIAALDQKRGISKDGDQPWKLSADKKYFYDWTNRYGANVLMGRRTYGVIGQPLRNRHNFLVTHDIGLRIPDVEVVHDLDGFIGQFEGDLWVIGGASVFEQTLPYAEELYITRINKDFVCDQFFPVFEDRFVLISKSEPQVENNTSFQFEVWKKG